MLSSGLGSEGIPKRQRPDRCDDVMAEGRDLFSSIGVGASRVGFVRVESVFWCDLARVFLAQRSWPMPSPGAEP